MDALTSYLDPSRRPSSPRSNASLQQQQFLIFMRGRAWWQCYSGHNNPNLTDWTAWLCFIIRSVWCRLVARKETRRSKAPSLSFLCFLSCNCTAERFIGGVRRIKRFREHFGQRLQGQPGWSRLEQGWKSWNDGFTLRDLCVFLWMN